MQSCDLYKTDMQELASYRQSAYSTANYEHGFKLMTETEQFKDEPDG